MSEFGDASQEYFERLQKKAYAPPGSPLHRYAARMLVDAAKVFYAFRAFCKKSGTLSCEDANNLETTFSIAEAMREADIPNVEIDGRSYAMNQVYRDMQIWTWKMYQWYPLRSRRKPDAYPQAYDLFFKVLKDTGVQNRLVVITTNYDLVYEFEAYRANIPCVYPLEHVQESEAGNDGRSRFCFVDADEMHRVPICKLHGSVNYFYDDACGPRCDPFVFTDLAGKTPIGKSRLTERVPAILADEAIWNIREKLGGSLTPEIIPPTYAKLTGRPWLRAVWNRAFRALANAEKIVFIGYSMPDSDGFMRALIHGAMAARGSGSPAQIDVVDPSEATRRRYERLFRRGIRSWPKRLGNITEGELYRILGT
jgi:hypothetical protein